MKNYFNASNVVSLILAGTFACAPAPGKRPQFVSLGGDPDATIPNQSSVIGAHVPIKSLVGIERANLVVHLHLHDHPISDLAPLRHCKQLRELGLGNTLVSDLGPLEHLELRELFIGNTRVRDLSPLKKMYSLRSLEIHDTDVIDLTPLRGLKNLRRLFAPGTRIKTIEGLPDGVEKIVISKGVDPASIRRYREKNPTAVIVLTD